jgi:hypothetical protein
LRLTVFLPQKVQMYRECWVISIFFTCLRKEAPYLFEDSSIHRIQFCGRGDRCFGVVHGAVEFFVHWGWTGLDCIPGTVFTGGTDLCNALSVTHTNTEIEESWRTLTLCALRHGD